MDVSGVANQAAAMNGNREQMAREVSVMLSANTGAYQKEMQLAAEQTNKLADALVKVEKAYQGTLKFIGKFAMGAGASMQASAAGATWAAAQFEESFARVAKTTGLENQLFGQTGRGADFMAALGIGDNALQQFQNDIRALSTEIPVSVQELAYLADVAGMLGVESENLVLFADTASKLGAAINDLGSDQAIAGLANLIGAFGRAETEVTNLGSSLADLANYTRGNASEILQFSDRLAGTAVQVNMTAEEVMGLGAAVSAIGARPELGASAIVQTMNTISMAVSSAGSDLERFAKAIGMTADDLAEMWQTEGATAVLTRLLTALNSQGGEAIQTLRALGLSGVGTTQILGGLAAQLGEYNRAMEISIEASEKGSAVAELAAVRFDTVYKSMQRLGQTTAEVFRSIGVGFLAPFKVLIDTMSGLVNIFNRLPQPIKTVLGLFAGLGGAALVAAGAFTIFFAKFHALFALIYVAPIMLRLMGKGLENLGAETARAVKHIEALAKKFESLGNFLSDTPKKIRALFAGISERGLIGTLSDAFDAGKKKVEEFWKAMVAPRVGAARESISRVFDKMWPKITEGVAGAKKAISDFSGQTMKRLGASLEGLRPVFERVGENLGGVWVGVTERLGEFAKRVRTVFSEMFPDMGRIFTNMREGFQRAWQRLFGVVDDDGPSIFQRLVTGARRYLTQFVDAFKEAMEGAREWISGGLEGAIPAIKKWVKDTARTLWNSFRELAGTVGDAIQRGMRRAMRGIGGFLEETLPRLAGIAAAGFKVLKDAVIGAAGTIVGAIRPVLKQAGEVFATVLLRIGRALKKDLWPAIVDVGEGLWKYLGKGLEAVGKAAKWVMKELFVKDTLKIMANSIRVMGKAAMFAAQPFVFLGKKIMASLGKPIVDKVNAVREALRSLGGRGGATMLSGLAGAEGGSAVARVFDLIATKARDMQVAFSQTFPLVGMYFQDLKRKAIAFKTAMWGIVGPQMIAMITMFRNTLVGLGMGFMFLLAPMAKIVLAATAVAGAIWGWEKWKSRNDETTNSLYKLAGAVGMVADEVDRVSWSLKNAGGGDLALAVMGKDVVSRLRSMDSDEAADLSFTYAATLVRGGQEPAQVAEHVNELRRLAGLGPIDFEFSFSDLSTGDGYEAWLDSSLESARNMFSGGFEDDMFAKSWGGNWFNFLNRIPEEFENAWDDNITQIKAIGDTNVPAMLAAVSATQEAIDEAFDSGAINTDERRKLRRMLAEELDELDAFDSQRGNAFQRMAAGGIDGIRGVFGFRGDESRIGAWTNRQRTGIDSPQNMIADLLGEDFDNVEDLEPVRQAVRDITGEFRNLDDVVRGMDADQFAEFMQQVEQSAVNTQHALAAVRVEGDTQLGRMLGEAQFSMNDTDFERYEQHLLKTYHHQVGSVKALRELYVELERITEKTGAWSEDAEKYRSAIQSIEQEFAQSEARRIELEVNNLPALQRVQHVVDELRALTDDPWNVELRAEIQVVLRQTLQQEEQRFRQTMQQYDQLVDRREESIRSHNENLERMEENFNRSRERAQENHDRNLSRMAEQRDKSVQQANKNHKKRLEDINKAEEKALEDRVKQQSRAFGLIERIQATPTASLGAVLDNMRAQNEAMEEMASGVRQLRQMGLHEDVMEGLGFNDPKNFAQVRRTLEWALSDPSMIDQINSAWKDRMRLSENFVDAADRNKIGEQFDEQRKQAKEALDQQVKDINERHREQIVEANKNFTRQQEDANENHQRQIEQAGENHQRQLEQIAEAMSKLGEDTFETIDELIEKAAESGLENLQRLATQLQVMQEQVDVLLNGPRGGSPAWIDEQWGIDYDSTPFRNASEQASKDILVGWRNNAPVTWRDLQADIARGSGRAIEPLNSNVEGGVNEAFDTLGLFRNQRNVWDPAAREARSGSASVVDAIVTEFSAGVDRIDRELGKYTDSLEMHLNPVIEATGGEPMDLTPQRRGSSGGTAAHRAGLIAADGALLPNQAKIQSPGTLVQWAEPETGGEAFIPLAPSKRQRSRMIWEKTGEILGINMSNLDPHSLHTYADGGFHNIPDLSDMGTIGKATEAAMRHVYEMLMESGAAIGGSASSYDQRLYGATAGGRLGVGAGWRAMWAALKAAFPGASLHSAYRPNAITATGRRSYHGQGRAIDVTPSVDIANWIRRNYMAPTREMIYSPMNNQQIHNGRNHYYATPITRAQHWDHVHWAMAMGDILTDEMKSARDNIPAMLDDGEFVMQAQAVKEYGLEMMQALNARRFSTGGLVGSSPKTRGREPLGNQIDLVNALTKALANASLGRSETNHWDVKVEANDTKRMIDELERKKRLSRLNGGLLDV